MQNLRLLLRPARTAVLLPMAALVLSLSAAASAQPLCGDCDENGVVNVLDAFAGGRHAVFLATLVGQGFDNCDIDGAGTVNVLDALVVAQFSAGLPVVFNCSSVATITITEISFDWSPTVPDGFGLRFDRTTDVQVPEWLPASSRNHPALFIGGTRPTIRFRATASPIGVTQATLNIVTGSALGDFSDVVVPFSGGVSGVIEIQLANPVPALTSKNAITFTWQSRDVMPGYASGLRTVDTTGPHTIYTVPATPSTPWATSGVNEPWTRALDYVTSWAGGSTTPDTTLTALTPPFRDNYGMMYDTTSGAPRYSAGGWTFNLTLMLSRLDTASVGIYNCYDAARALQVFGSLAGGNYRFWFMDGPAGFFVNCIDLNGRGWCNSPFYSADGSVMIRPPDMAAPRWAFGNHGYTGPQMASPPSPVWDATFAGDGDTNPDEPPHIRTDMVDLPFALYSAIAVDDNPFRVTNPPYVITFGIQ